MNRLRSRCNGSTGRPKSIDVIDFSAGVIDFRQDFMHRTRSYATISVLALVLALRLSNLTALQPYNKRDQYSLHSWDRKV